MWYFPWNSVPHVPVLWMLWTGHTETSTHLSLIRSMGQVFVWYIYLQHKNPPFMDRQKQGWRCKTFSVPWRKPKLQSLGSLLEKVTSNLRPRRHKTYASSPVVYWWDFLDANFLRVLNCSFDEAYKWDMFSGYSHANATPPSRNKALLRTTNHHCPLVGPFFFGVVIGRVPPKHRQGLIHPINPVIFWFVLGRCCLGDVWTEIVEKHEFLALLISFFGIVKQESLAFSKQMRKNGQLRLVHMQV